MKEEVAILHSVLWTTLPMMNCLLSYQRGLRKNSTTSRITTDTRSLHWIMLTREDSLLMSEMCETCLETSTSSATRLTLNYAPTRKCKRPASSSTVSSAIHARELGVSSPIFSRKLESRETPSPSTTWKGTAQAKTSLCMPLTINSNT